jgi:methylthioribose-1-phosphate isomerase
VAVRNPAFDVTPHRYLTAIITERGIARAPFADSLRALATTTETEPQSTQRTQRTGS